MKTTLETLAGRAPVCGPLPGAGRAVGTFWQVAWPAAAEYVLLALVASVDLVMVGGLGPWAISAVGLANQPRLAVLAFSHAIGAGTTAICARRFGQNNQDGANRCLKQAVMLTALVSLVVCALAYVFALPVVDWVGAQADSRHAAALYLRITLPGTFLSAVAMVINAGQRAVGNTALALKTNVAANLVNLCLNYLLIHGHLGFPAWGVAGAAAATTAGFVVSFALSLAAAYRPGRFLTFRYRCPWRLDGEALRLLTRLSWPALIEQLCMRVGLILYSKVVAELGTNPFAAHQICMRIIDPIYMLGEGLGVGAATLVGRELGRGRPDLSMIYSRVGQGMALAVSVVMAGVLALARRPLVRVFTDDGSVARLAAQLMLLVAVCCLCMCLMSVLGGSLRGAGDTSWVARGALVGQMLLRPGIGFLLCYPLGLGVAGAWLGLLADYAARAGLYGVRFAHAKWTNIQV